MIRINVEMMNINGAPVGVENPLPFFRDRQHDLNVSCIEPFPAEKKCKLGYEAGFRVLPYRFQDRLTRKRLPMLLKKIVMENNCLKASFLPEMGGRLISLIEKSTGRELLSRNPVFQPANLAIRKAWFSGGIEWNIGQAGHAFHTCSPVFAAVVKGKGGERFLRIYEFERCKRLFWQIDFYLPEDSQVLYAYTRVINPNDEEVPMYWWTNIAVPETPEARVFASAEDVIYCDPTGFISGHKGYGYAEMPVIPSLPGKDCSYPFNSEFSNEYFFQCPPQKMPWEAIAYKEGGLFFEASTERLRYRKMFCWGNHSGGRQWQQYLSEQGIAYLEIQAGLVPTQIHGLDMPARAVWDWTQAFGGTKVKAEDVYDRDWSKAKSYVDAKIKDILTQKEIYNRETSFRTNADIIPEDILQMGPGWGALEMQRMQAANEGNNAPGQVYPLASMEEDQYPWLFLLENGEMPQKSVEQLPGAWMVQKEWKNLLFSSLREKKNCNWYALLHAGVMAFEEGDEKEARKLWIHSLENKESVWAYRNLAVMEEMSGNLLQAVSYMEKAMEIPFALTERALIEEYMALLSKAGKYQKAWEFFIQIPDVLQSAERIQLIAGTIAVELGKYEFVERLFEYDYACIQEGETTLTDLWFKYQAFKLAEKKGVQVDSEILNYVVKTMSPPLKLDFRAINEVTV